MAEIKINKYLGADRSQAMDAYARYRCYGMYFHMLESNTKSDGFEKLFDIFCLVGYTIFN